ncbi:putative glycoprotein [Emaravirus camelliae]|uniref:Putative glycoprotein n=1 Tax=Emaravirus camelliae TaxID=2843907 RepID=A0A6B9EJD5_9VIRU|nr:putative glycoprotein [Emaravirus camelliae]QGX73504.1 putative glycoprotein [Emaravirus camelliae]
MNSLLALCVCIILLVAMLIEVIKMDKNSLISEYKFGRNTFGIKNISEDKECQSHFEVINGDINLCTTDKIDTEMEKISENCYKTENEIFIYNCYGKSNYRVKPKLNLCHSFSTSICNVITIIKKFIKMILTVVITRLLKPILLLFINLISKRFGKKICKSCEKNYLFIHDECYVKSHKSTPNQIIFYLLTFASLITVTHSVEVNKLYTERVEHNLTKIKLVDEENILQVFNDGNNHIEAVIRYSLIEHHCQYSHDVLKIDETNVIDSITVCHNVKDRCKEFIKNKGYFEHKMSVDHWDCIFSQAVHCGYCDVKTSIIGKVYRCGKSSPLIQIDLKLNQNKYKIEINSTKRIQKEYEIAYEPVQVESKMFLMYQNLEESKFYTGDICNKPDSSCFGDLIKKDDDVNLLFEPDTKDFNGEFELNKCVRKNDVKEQNLELTSIQYDSINKRFIQDHNFGLINLAIDGEYILDKNICKNKAKVVRLIANGCYDCLSGFKLIIIMTQIDKKNCYSVKCNINGVYRSFNVIDKELFNLNLYSDKKVVEVSCNNFKKVFELNKSNDYNDFTIHKSLNVKSRSIKEDIFEFFSFNFFNFNFKMIFMASLAFIVFTPSIYFVYHILKFLNHVKKIKRGNYVEVELRNVSTAERLFKDVVV